MQQVLDFIWNNFPIVAAVLIAALSELFALIPSMKSNSILQLVYNLLSKFSKK
jgi:hypothetical protein